MLGTVNNPPTRAGMLDRISFFQKNKCETIQLLIAGFGTESLKDVSKTDKDNILVIGSI